MPSRQYVFKTSPHRAMHLASPCFPNSGLPRFLAASKRENPGLPQVCTGEVIGARFQGPPGSDVSATLKDLLHSTN